MIADADTCSELALFPGVHEQRTYNASKWR